jgi:hypothetical protein
MFLFFYYFSSSFFFVLSFLLTNVSFRLSYTDLSRDGTLEWKDFDMARQVDISFIILTLPVTFLAYINTDLICIIEQSEI